MVLGSPGTVRAGIDELAAAYGAEEVIVVSITFDHAARRRTYELIAQAYSLSGARAADAVAAAPARA
jgi:alkanesulfonate monooxygenase SsuD/methylene tetrahydromethanopterin reductase-like flavin-dependent oxidoreductase (luciferase family)